MMRLSMRVARYEAAEDEARAARIRVRQGVREHIHTYIHTYTRTHAHTALLHGTPLRRRTRSVGSAITTLLGPTKSRFVAVCIPCTVPSARPHRAASSPGSGALQAAEAELSLEAAQAANLQSRAQEEIAGAAALSGGGLASQGRLQGAGQGAAAAACRLRFGLQASKRRMDEGSMCLQD
jgi:hypothetical protein